MKDLECRVDFFSTWAEILCKTIEQQFRQATQQTGQQDIDMSDPIRIQPNSFWLSAFFFPQGRYDTNENICRKKGIFVFYLLQDTNIYYVNMDTYKYPHIAIYAFHLSLTT